MNSVILAFMAIVLATMAESGPISLETFHFQTQDVSHCLSKDPELILNNYEVRRGGDESDLNNQALLIFEATKSLTPHYKICLCFDFGVNCKVLDGANL